MDTSAVVHKKKCKRSGRDSNRFSPQCGARLLPSHRIKVRSEKKR
jgi:hypothetical protein